jgi:uncharacterized protein (DUF488 family)
MKTTRLISILGIVTLLSCCEEKAKDTAPDLAAENAEIKSTARSFVKAVESKVQNDAARRYTTEMELQMRGIIRRHQVLIGILSLDGRHLSAKQMAAWSKVISGPASDDVRDSESFNRLGEEGYAAPYALASVVTELALAEKAAVEALRLEHTHQKISEDTLNQRRLSNDHMSKVVSYLEAASSAVSEDLKKAPVK